MSWNWAEDEAKQKWRSRELETKEGRFKQIMKFNKKKKKEAAQTNTKINDWSVEYIDKCRHEMSSRI